MNYGMHPLTRRRLAVICGLMRCASGPVAIAELVRAYLREVAR